YKKYKNVADLMTIFNHSSPAITLIYIGVRQDDLDTKMANFDI
ncbi:TPA: site-specific integrase, partial [Streptococcus suis]